MAPTQAPALARLADHLLDGGLAAFIRERRPETSWDTIARDLWARTNGEVDATGPTVQSWWERLEIEEGAA